MLLADLLFAVVEQVLTFLLTGLLQIPLTLLSDFVLGLAP